MTEAAMSADRVMVSLPMSGMGRLLCKNHLHILSYS
jgi:hypothetical protein